MDNHKRIESLQVFRGIFALFVVVQHAGNFVWSGGSSSCYFFLISGFLMSMIYENRITQGFNYWRFMAKRVLNIYPLHLLCLVVLLAYSYYFNFITLEDVRLSRSSFLLLQSWDNTPYATFAGNPPTWFLCDILFCYALFPFLQKFKNRKPRAFFVLLAIAITTQISVCFLFPPEVRYYRPIYIFPPTRAIDFMIGMALWALVSSLKKSNVFNHIQRLSTIQRVSILLAPILIIASMMYFRAYIPDRSLLSNAWWLPLSSLIIIYVLFEFAGCQLFSFGSDTLQKYINLFLNSIKYCGNITLYILITHFLAIRITKVVMESFGISSVALLTGSTLVLTIIFSHYLYKVADPILKKTAKKLSI